MHHVAFGRGDEVADFIKTGRRQPAVAAAALNRKAVSGLLIGPTKLVSAFMRENPLLHGCRDTSEQLGVHDQEAGVSGAVVVPDWDPGPLGAGHTVAFARQASARQRVICGRHRQRIRHIPREWEGLQRPPGLACRAKVAEAAASSTGSTIGFISPPLIPNPTSQHNQLELCVGNMINVWFLSGRPHQH